MYKIICYLGVLSFMLAACQDKKSGNLYQERESIGKNSALSQDVFLPEENNYELFWEDNFEGETLDTSKWRMRGIGARRIGFNDPSMIKVENGNLLLMYDIKADSILAGAVGTGETFLTTYGYFECRAELQKGIGPWAAFWMQSPFISKGEDPGKFGTDIDIFEYFKELGENHLTHCLHWAYGPNQKTSGRMDSDLDNLSKGFHTFALEWTPEKYVFYIDGLKFHEQKQGLSHVDEYMILSMEIPSKLEGIKNACAPDTFKVDYVKVYKKKE